MSNIAEALKNIEDNFDTYDCCSRTRALLSALQEHFAPASEIPPEPSPETPA